MDAQADAEGRAPQRVAKLFGLFNAVVCVVCVIRSWSGGFGIDFNVVVGCFWLHDALLCFRIRQLVHSRAAMPEVRRAAGVAECWNLVTLIVFAVLVMQPLLSQLRHGPPPSAFVTIAILVIKVLQFRACRFVSGWAQRHEGGLVAEAAPAPALAAAPAMREARPQPASPPARPSQPEAAAPALPPPVVPADARSQAAPPRSGGEAQGRRLQDCEAMQIEVPEGALPGQTIAIRWADGSTHHLVLPEQLPANRFLVVGRSEGADLQVLA